MQKIKNTKKIKNILITGAARRIGACTARLLHADGANIMIHYRSSDNEANKLCDELNQIRNHSAKCFQADLLIFEQIKKLADDVMEYAGNIDVLINNASSYFSTDFNTATIEQWETLMGSNLIAPFFLTQYLSSGLKSNHGCVVNIVDIHADRPVKNYSVYCMAKAGLVMMTKALAIELNPEVRVNAVAPGAILWPENNINTEEKNKILSKIPLQRVGGEEAIAKTIQFLIDDDSYIHGEIVKVDGGRSVVS